MREHRNHTSHARPTQNSRFTQNAKHMFRFFTRYGQTSGGGRGIFFIPPPVSPSPPPPPHTRGDPEREEPADENTDAPNDHPSPNLFIAYISYLEHDQPPSSKIRSRAVLLSFSFFTTVFFSALAVGTCIVRASHVDRPTDRSIDRPIDRPTDQPTGQLTDRPTCLP